MYFKEASFICKQEEPLDESLLDPLFLLPVKMGGLSQSHTVIREGTTRGEWEVWGEGRFELCANESCGFKSAMTVIIVLGLVLISTLLSAKTESLDMYCAQVSNYAASPLVTNHQSASRGRWQEA